MRSYFCLYFYFFNCVLGGWCYNIDVMWLFLVFEVNSFVFKGNCYVVINFNEKNVCDIIIIIVVVFVVDLLLFIIFLWIRKEGEG